MSVHWLIICRVESDFGRDEIGFANALAANGGHLFPLLTHGTAAQNDLGISPLYPLHQAERRPRAQRIQPSESHPANARHRYVFIVVFMWKTRIKIHTVAEISGALETVRIRKSGYSHRLTFADFLRRYSRISFAIRF